MVKKFSETHTTAKKCLWLEYRDNDLDLEKKLKGLHEDRSHYYLINTAKDLGWFVFAVDGTANLGWSVFDTGRDPYMADKITKTIQDGQCEKGMSINGNGHLSCTVEPPYRCSRGLKLDKLLEDNLKNSGLAKSIGILRIIPSFLLLQE